MVAVTGTPQAFNGTALGSGTTWTYTGGGATGANVYDVLFVNSDTVVNTPTGWTSTLSRVNGQGAYVFTNTGGTTTATFSTSGNFPTQGIWIRVANAILDTGTPGSAGADGVGGVTTPAFTSAALAAAGELAFAFGALHSAGTSTLGPFTWSTGYTEILANVTSPGTNGAPYGSVASKPSAGTAAESPQMSWASFPASDRYILFVSFKDSGASTTPFTRDYASTWRVTNALTRDYASTWRSLVGFNRDYASTWRGLSAFTVDYSSTWRSLGTWTRDYASVWRVLNSWTTDYASTWRGLNAVTRDYSDSWRVTNSFARDYLSTWVVLAGTAFVRDYASTWRVYNTFSADYVDTYRVLGPFARDYASTYRVLAAITRDYSSTWRVFHTFSRDYSSTWIVLGDETVGLIVQVWSGGQLVSATLAVWNGTSEVPAIVEAITP